MRRGRQLGALILVFAIEHGDIAFLDLFRRLPDARRSAFYAHASLHAASLMVRRVRYGVSLTPSSPPKIAKRIVHM
jgi:hypothetical protein